MKVKSYHALYRVFSFLSDKSNGASLFVKYKLALGIILVGLTTVSCSKDEEEPPLMCYDPVSIPQETSVNNEGTGEIPNIGEKETMPVTQISEEN
jgi:hypothetical protein